MSGGSLDYISHRIEDAESIIYTRTRGDPQLQAFCKHLHKIGVALHDIEWDLSGDSSLDEDARKNITDIIGQHAELEYLYEEAKTIRDELDKRLREVGV